MKKMLAAVVLVFMVALSVPADAQEVKAPIHLRFASLDLGSAWYVYAATFAKQWREVLPKGSTAVAGAVITFSQLLRGNPVFGWIADSVIRTSTLLALFLASGALFVISWKKEDPDRIVILFSNSTPSGAEYYQKFRIKPHNLSLLLGRSKNDGFFNIFQGAISFFGAVSNIETLKNNC